MSKKRSKYLKGTAKKGTNSLAAGLAQKMSELSFVEIVEGDRVRLNVERIKSHPDYERLTGKYHRFIDSHSDDIFTVCYDESKGKNPALVCLKEDADNWLFWTGDLIKVENSEEGVTED